MGRKVRVCEIAKLAMGNQVEKDKNKPSALASNVFAIAIARSLFFTSERHQATTMLPYLQRDISIPLQQVDIGKPISSSVKKHHSWAIHAYSTPLG